MQGVEILAARDDRVLTDEALAFVAGLHRDFNPERERLLAARGERMARLEAGEIPIFEPGLEEVVAENRATGRLRFTTDAVAAIAHVVGVGFPSSRVVA